MRSMTAYASVHRKKGPETVQVFLRSTNFKYLEVSIHNLPIEEMFLEEKIKKEIKKKIYRGKIEVHVFLKKAPTGDFFIDEKSIEKYVEQIKKIAKKYKIDPSIHVTDLLSLPQVVRWEENKQEDGNFLMPLVVEGINKLTEFKQSEGEIIKQEMQKNLKLLIENAEQMKKHKPKASAEENNKEDIDEEISLMSFYAKKMGQEMNDDKGVLKGKTLDFLTQEILRELNAASSKTRNKTVATQIVEAKTYLERIREQAQNIE